MGTRILPNKDIKTTQCRVETGSAQGLFICGRHENNAFPVFLVKVFKSQGLRKNYGERRFGIVRKMIGQYGSLLFLEYMGLPFSQ